MSISETVHSDHLGRLAVVYVRQSSPHQALANQESLKLQYNLRHRARAAGWDPSHVRVIDSDLGRTGRTAQGRRGFQELVALVNQEQVGIIFAYDVTRLARNCTDWYQVLDLCGYRRCLVGDRDGIYDPSTINGRLLLGLKGTMSEAELHIIRARLDGGIRNKAARGELRRGLPVGFVWGEQDGEICFHPDESVCAAIRTVFARFAELGSARRVWLWFRSEEPVVSTADLLRRYHPLGRPELHRHLSCALQSGLCGRLCLWQEPPRSLPRWHGCAQGTRAQAAAITMVRVHPEPP